MYGQLQDEQDGSLQRVRSSRAYTRLGDAAALAVPELTLLPRLLHGARRRWVVLIVAGTVAFLVGVAVLIFIWNSANEKTARRATSRLGAALIHNDPNGAPAGAAEYVTGIRTYFGPVTSAQLIGTHQKAVGHDPYTRSFYVAELLLGTRRGPAVLEVEFDNDSINGDRVSSVFELAPRSAPGLSAAQRKELDAALAARGHKLADAATLSLAASSTAGQGAATTPATPTPPTPSSRIPVPVSPAASNPAMSAEAQRLQCLRAAHGDVTKLARCAQ
jgi:hypothetical protein